MRDQTRGDEDMPGPRRGQSSQPATAALPAASPPALSPPSRPPHRRRRLAGRSAFGDRRTPRAPPQAPAPVGDLDQRRRHRVLVAIDRHRAVRDRVEPRRTREPAAEEPAPAPPAAVEAIEFPQDEPAAAARRRAVRDGERDVVVRERRDGREPRRRLQQPAARRRRLVRHRRRPRKTSPGVAAESAAAGFPNLAPEPEADRVAARLLHLARRSPGPTAPPPCRADGTSVALLEHRARDARDPRRDDRMGCRGADVERRLRGSGRPRPLERPRPPGVGRVQARQDEPAGGDLGRGRDVRVVRHRSRVARRTSPPPQVADPAVQAEVREHETGDQPLHGHARALPLARAPGRGIRFRRRLPLGGHRRREVGVGLQPRHHEPRRRHPHRRANRRRSSSCRSTRPTGTTSPTTPRCVLTGDWVDQNEAEAAADFIRYAQHRAGPGDRARRPATATSTATLDDGVAKSASSPPTQQGALALPGQDVVPPSTRRSRRCASARNVLFLLDVSGSMDEPIPAGDTKLDQARKAIARRSDHFTAGDNVGLAAFAQGPDGAMLPGNVSPVADIGAIARRVPRRARRAHLDG